MLIDQKLIKRMKLSAKKEVLCTGTPDTYHILVSHASHVYLSCLAYSGI